MAIKLESKTRVTAPAAPYPYGVIKDTTPSEKGTPVNVEVYGDFHQFFAKLAAESGITLNDLPDNDTNTWQYFQALLNVMNTAVGKASVLSRIETYTTNDLIVLYGCEVTANIPGTSSITAGAIYYNDYIYYVPADASISSPANTLVFKIDETVNPKFIYLDNGVSGSGIANYNGATVKELNQRGTSNAFVSAFSVSNSSFSSCQANFIRNGNVANVSLRCVFTIINGASSASVVLSSFTGFTFQPNSLTNPITGNYTVYNNTLSTLDRPRLITQGLNATDISIDANGRILLAVEAGTYVDGTSFEFVVNFTALVNI